MARAAGATGRRPAAHGQRREPGRRGARRRPGRCSSCMAIPSTARSGAHQIDALEGYRRIAPDLRGMGQSDAPDLGYSMEIYADGPGRSARRARAWRTSCSAGCRWAATSPSSSCDAGASGCAAWSSWTPGPKPTAPRRGGRATPPPPSRARAAPTAIADAMLPKVLASATTERAPDIVERVRRIMASHAGRRDRRRAGRHARPARQHRRFCPTLAGLPTLVMVGEEDALTPPDAARGMAAAIPGARLVVDSRQPATCRRVERPVETDRRDPRFLRVVGLKPFPAAGRSSTVAAATGSHASPFDGPSNYGSGVAAKQYDPGATLLVWAQPLKACERPPDR